MPALRERGCKAVSVPGAFSARRARADSGPANELSFDDSVMPSGTRSGEEEFDPLTQVASEETLGERLMADLGAILAPEDMPIAECRSGPG